MVGSIVAVGVSLAFVTGPFVRPPKAPDPGRSAARARERRDGVEERQQREWRLTRNPRTGRVPDRIRQRELQHASRLPTAEALRERAERDPLAGLPRHSAGALRPPHPPETGASAPPSPPRPALQNWVLRGPNDVSGRVRALAVDRTDGTEATLLAGGVSGGMWRSTNGGQTWTKTTTQAQLQSVTCVLQDGRPGQGQTWWYGTGERSGNSASASFTATYLGDGIFKSTDGGQTWAVLPATSTGTPHSYDNSFDYVWSLAMDRSNLAQAEIYAATAAEISRSTDGGTTWQTVHGNGSSGNSRDVAVTSTGVVYATANSSATGSAGIWVSTSGDPGSFADITPPGIPAGFGRIVIAISPSNENLVYFAGQHQGGHFLYLYDRSGPTMTDRSAGLPGDLDSQGGYDLLAAVKPSDPSFVLVGGTNLFRSTNGFADQSATTQIGGYGVPGFEQPNGDYPNHHPDQHAIVFSTVSPSRLWSGNDGGVYRADDATTQQVAWTKLNNGFTTTQYYSVAIDEATAGNSIIVGGLQDRGNFFTSTAGNGGWPELTGSDGAIDAVANGRSHYYIEIQKGVLRRMVISDTGVVSTGQTTRIDPQAATDKQFVNPYVLDPNDSETMYYVGGKQIWRNTSVSTADTTTGWTGVLGAITPGLGTFTAITATRANPANRLWLGTDNGQVYLLDGAKTANLASPTDVWTGKGFPAGANVICIAVDPQDGGHAIAVFSNYEVLSLFRTTDSGATWAAISGNLEQNADGSGNGPSCRWAAIVRTPAPTTYYVATSTGLYSTTAIDGMSTVWAQEGASVIGNVVCVYMATRPADGLVVVGTHGAGVYSNTGGNATCAPDTTPPVVTPPAGLTVNQSTCNGATPGLTLATLQARDATAGAQLAAFLVGGSATDGCSGTNALASQLGGADAATAFFGVGANSVTFRFQDVATNVGTATATVTVRRQGDADLSGVVDIFDIVAIANLIVGNVQPGNPPFTAPTNRIADHDNSGVVDIFDLVRQANFTVGNFTCLVP